MNEQIKLLAEEVGAKELGADLYGGEFIGAVRLDFLEKFAERIVRDCAGYIHGHELFTALLNRYGVTE